MKLLIQIPCFNEEHTLPLVLREIPREIPGIDRVEVLIIDDGSTDATVEVARALGVDHVVRHPRNLGLARSFRDGLDACLKRGADLIVNIDGDNQYKASDIPRLVAPIVAGRADMVIGDRQTHTISHFSPVKKALQRLGSAVVRRLSGVQVRDAVSGFRAFSAPAARRLNVLSTYTYTLETLLQARAKGLVVEEIPIVTNPKLRESRLIKSLRGYILRSIETMVRTFTLYNPLQVFLSLGATFVGAGVLIGLRFLYFYFESKGSGHVQSLILAAILTIVGALIIMVGMLADLIRFNRLLIEDVLERMKVLEARVGRPEPGDRSAGRGEMP